MTRLFDAVAIADTVLTELAEQAADDDRPAVARARRALFQNTPRGRPQHDDADVLSAVKVLCNDGMPLGDALRSVARRMDGQSLRELSTSPATTWTERR